MHHRKCLRWARMLSPRVIQITGCVRKLHGRVAPGSRMPLASSTMLSRGRNFVGAPRAATAMLVALLATVTALLLFFRVNSQPFGSPLDQLGSQMDAGNDTPEPSDPPDYAEPAPPSITISTTLERTASIESYLREAGMERDDARQWASYIQRITANRYFHSGHPLTLYKDPETGEMRGLRNDLDANTTVTEASLGAGIIKASLPPIEYFIRPIKLTFAVKDSFQRAAVENKIPKPIIE